MVNKSIHGLVKCLLNLNYINFNLILEGRLILSSVTSNFNFPTIIL